jgi:hypothetical protein
LKILAQHVGLESTTIRLREKIPTFQQVTMSFSTADFIRSDDLETACSDGSIGSQGWLCPRLQEYFGEKPRKTESKTFVI